MEAALRQFGIYDSVNEYRLIPVFEKTSNEIRQRIIQLWQDNRALPAEVNADDRARQALFVVIGREDRVVAVSTVYISDMRHTGMANAPQDIFYFYRMFIRPQDRVGHLAKTMVMRAYDYLKSLNVANNPKGIAAIALNPKLMRRSLQLAFHDIGWEITGKDDTGNLIYRRDF